MLYAVFGIVFGMVGTLIIEAVLFFLLFIWEPTRVSPPAVTCKRRDRIYRRLFWVTLVLLYGVALAGLVIMLAFEGSRAYGDIFAYAQIAAVSVHAFIYWRCERLGIVP
jgi:hypothetical protein